MTIPAAPKPCIDPSEPPHPDQQDTISPGLTDESGLLPIKADCRVRSLPVDAAEVATEQSSG